MQIFGNRLIFSSQISPLIPAIFYGRNINLVLKKSLIEKESGEKQDQIQKNDTFFSKIRRGLLMMSVHAIKINLLSSFIPCEENSFQREENLYYKFNSSICRNYGKFQKNEKDFFNFWKNRIFSDFIWISIFYRFLVYEYGIIFFNDFENINILNETKNSLFLGMFYLRFYLPYLYLFWIIKNIIISKKFDILYSPLSFAHCFRILYIYFCFDLAIILLYFFDGRDLEECFSSKNCLLTFIGQIMVSIFFILELFMSLWIGFRLKPKSSAKSSFEISEIIFNSVIFFHVSEWIRNLLGSILWCINFYPFDCFSLYSLVFIILFFVSYLIISGFRAKNLYSHSKKYLFIHLYISYLKILFLFLLFYFLNLGCEEQIQALYGFLSANFSFCFSFIICPFSIIMLRNILMSKTDIDEEKKYYKHFCDRRIEYI